MAMLTLRQRNSGKLTAVNLATISFVTATVADERYEAAPVHEKAPSPVYLSIAFAGESEMIRFVTVDYDGEEDVTITNADEAIRNFAAAARRA